MILLIIFSKLLKIDEGGEQKVLLVLFKSFWSVEMIPDDSRCFSLRPLSPPISLANPPLHNTHSHPMCLTARKKNSVFPFIDITFSIIFPMALSCLNVGVTLPEITSYM